MSGGRGERGGPWSLLSRPRFYDGFQRAVGAGLWRRALVAEYGRPRQGEKVLDLGCGQGALLAYMSGVDYVGVDVNGDYIAAAQRRFAGRGRFIAADATTLDELALGPFDCILGAGLLHHIEDAPAAAVMAAAARLLTPDGRMATLDPCLAPGQPALARFLVSKDRGRCVRDRAAYGAIAATAFTRVETALRDDLLRLPYTHIIMTCRGPRS